MRKFTGQNKSVAKFLGVPEDQFDDPGFCLGCGESQCECYENAVNDIVVQPLKHKRATTEERIIGIFEKKS